MSFDALEKATESLPFELYLFQLTGQEFALTSADQAIAYGARTYEPTVMTRTGLDQSQEMNAGQVTISLPKAHPLSALFVPYLPAGPVALTIFAGHASDPEIVAIFSGKVASAQYKEECQLLCVPDQDQVKKQIPFALYQAGCAHIFGDAGCTFDLTTVTYAGTVSAIDPTGTIVTVSSFALATTLSNGYLQRGTDVRMIVAQSGSTVTLIEPITGLAIGDSVTAVAGCAHTYAACTHYANVPNFLGFDMIPTQNPFSGSLV